MLEEGENFTGWAHRARAECGSGGDRRPARRPVVLGFVRRVTAWRDGQRADRRERGWRWRRAGGVREPAESRLQPGLAAPLSGSESVACLSGKCSEMGLGSFGNSTVRCNREKEGAAAMTSKAKWLMCRCRRLIAFSEEWSFSARAGPLEGAPLACDD